MHLLDTPVIGALRQPRPGDGLTGWASRVARESLFMSVISLHELERLAAQAGGRDRGARALWRGWIDDHVMPAFEGRILPVDASVVRRAAALGYRDQRDGLLAATALEHGLTLVTSRLRAYKAGRVKLFDPHSYAPETEVEDWRQAARAAPTWVKNLFVRS